MDTCDMWWEAEHVAVESGGSELDEREMGRECVSQHEGMRWHERSDRGYKDRCEGWLEVRTNLPTFVFDRPRYRTNDYYHVHRWYHRRAACRPCK